MDDHSCPACVYTTMIGSYEQLNEQPAAASSGLRFVCLTDNPDLRSDSWEMRVVEPLFHLDPIRSQRDLKIRPHVHLPEFSASLYIDNSVILKSPVTLLPELLERRMEFALPLHSFRDNVLDEFLEVSHLRLDDDTRIFEQLNHYAISHPDVLSERPYWTGILLRDHRSARVRAMLEIWASHVMRYSRRDQLSVNVAFLLAGLRPEQISIDNRASDCHTWPHVAGRDREKGHRRISESLKPAVARVQALQRTLGERDKGSQRPREDGAQNGSIIADLRGELAVLRQDSELLTAIRNSTTWKLTDPIRRIGQYVPEPLRRLPRNCIAAVAGIISRGLPPLSLKPRPATQGSSTVAKTESRVRGRSGDWIYVDPADERGRRLVESGGDLNPPTLIFWHILLQERNWTHVVDIGANYGEMLANGGLPQGAHIIAVEPNPGVRALLKKTLRKAGIAATVLDVAVSQTIGSGQLIIDGTWSGTTRLALPDEAGSLPVSVTTLGKVLLGTGAPLEQMRVAVKIDVEGQEANVLRGGLEEIASLSDYTALVEVLHVSDLDLAWIEEHFEMRLLSLDDGARLVAVPPGQLRNMLKSGCYYAQDVALRRWPPGCRARSDGPQVPT